MPHTSELLALLTGLALVWIEDEDLDLGSTLHTDAELVSEPIANSELTSSTLTL